MEAKHRNNHRKSGESDRKERLKAEKGFGQKDKARV